VEFANAPVLATSIFLLVFRKNGILQFLRTSCCRGSILFGSQSILGTGVSGGLLRYYFLGFGCLL